MVDELIPQAVRLKQHMENPPRLIDDYEIAAAIGLACREIGEELPEGSLLSEVQKVYAGREDLNPILRYLIGSRLADDRRPEWRRLMAVGYHYQR